MNVFQTKKELQKTLNKLKKSNSSVGFVPTMGALHAGHISLVERAFQENDIVVVSIFINPTQFDNKNDLAHYPKSLEKDAQLIQTVSNSILIFAPTKEEIYDGNITSKVYDFNGLEKVMEGEFRTGHFNGVATIVELLLDAVKPNRAYFGEKDFQQLQIINRLVEIRQLPYQIIQCPIEREDNGLARSSRNERLSETVRIEAGIIYKSLQTAKKKFGTESAISIKDWVTQVFEANTDFTLEYFEIADIMTLTPMVKIQENVKYRAFIAVYVEDVRLIDNIALN